MHWFTFIIYIYIRVYIYPSAINITLIYSQVLLLWNTLITTLISFGSFSFLRSHTYSNIMWRSFWILSSFLQYTLNLLLWSSEESTLCSVWLTYPNLIIYFQPLISIESFNLNAVWSTYNKYTQFTNTLPSNLNLAMLYIFMKSQTLSSYNLILNSFSFPLPFSPSFPTYLKQHKNIFKFSAYLQFIIQSNEVN